MKTPLIVYWARRDLRLADNPALSAAVTDAKSKGVLFLPIFIIEDYMIADDPSEQFGYPSRWFLSQTLPKFAKQFSQFAVVRGKAVQYLTTFGKQYDLSIYVNDDVHPDFYNQIKKLRVAGIVVHVHNDALTIPRDTRTGSGKIYSVFTPFRNACWRGFVSADSLEIPAIDDIKSASTEVLQSLSHRIEATTAALSSLFSTERLLKAGSEVIDLTPLLPLPTLAHWYTDEQGARNNFERFLASGALDSYDEGRNSLENDARFDEVIGTLSSPTSRMSLALAWGLISARTLVTMIKDHFGETFDNQTSNRVSQGALSYISELLWREFYRYQLLHRPELLEVEFQERFRGTTLWVEDGVAHERFLAWITGETGYPVVDAAMHQLATLGWMHNRARMIVASVLTKNLGVDWRWGQEYFRAALIDLDEASNNGGWQWGASVGTDPKPIRIFNPELQAKNYDASGAYRARWLPNNDERLAIVEHKVAREEALQRYGLSSVKPRNF